MFVTWNKFQKKKFCFIIKYLNLLDICLKISLLFCVILLNYSLYGYNATNLLFMNTSLNVNDLFINEKIKSIYGEDIYFLI